MNNFLLKLKNLIKYHAWTDCKHEIGWTQTTIIDYSCNNKCGATYEGMHAPR